MHGAGCVPSSAVAGLQEEARRIQAQLAEVTAKFAAAEERVVLWRSRAEKAEADSDAVRNDLAANKVDANERCSQLRGDVDSLQVRQAVVYLSCKLWHARRRASNEDAVGEFVREGMMNLDWFSCFCVWCGSTSLPPTERIDGDADSARACAAASGAGGGSSSGCCHGEGDTHCGGG